MTPRIALLVLVAAAPAAFADPQPGGSATVAPAVDPAADTVADPPPPAPPPVDLRDLPPPSMGLSEMVVPLLKTMLALLVVVGLAYLTLHKGLGKLVERQNIGKRVKVVERTALDPKRSLFLVEVDGKQMLLAGGEGGVVHIRDLDAPDVQDAPRGIGARFADALKQKVAGDPPVTTGLATSADEKVS